MAPVGVRLPSRRRSRRRGRVGPHPRRAGRDRAAAGSAGGGAEDAQQPRRCNGGVRSWLPTVGRRLHFGQFPPLVVFAVRLGGFGFIEEQFPHDPSRKRNEVRCLHGWNGRTPCVPLRTAVDQSSLALCGEPKLAANFVLDKPAKLLEELPHRPSATHDTLALGYCCTSVSPCEPASLRLWTARLLMAKVRRPACLFPAVATDANLERSAFDLPSHSSSRRPGLWAFYPGSGQMQGPRCCHASRPDRQAVTREWHSAHGRHHRDVAHPQRREMFAFRHHRHTPGRSRRGRPLHRAVHVRVFGGGRRWSDSALPRQGCRCL
jgi:hypothetical protein